MHVFFTKKAYLGWADSLERTGALPFLWVVFFDPILLAVLVSFGALGHKTAELSMGHHQKLHSMLQKWMKSNADVASCLYSKKIIFLVLQHLAGSYNVSQIKWPQPLKWYHPSLQKKGQKNAFQIGFECSSTAKSSWPDNVAWRCI